MGPSGLQFLTGATGALSIALGFLFLLPTNITYVYVTPVAPSAETCSGVLVPFPYQGPCPPNYAQLQFPFSFAVLLPMLLFGLGAADMFLVLALKGPVLNSSILLASAGLVSTVLGSNIGLAGNQGWPINWFLSPFSHPPSSNYFPVCIVVWAFLADWAIFSIFFGLLFLLASKLAGVRR